MVKLKQAGRQQQVIIRGWVQQQSTSNNQSVMQACTQGVERVMHTCVVRVMHTRVVRVMHTCVVRVYTQQ